MKYYSNYNFFFTIKIKVYFVVSLGKFKIILQLINLAWVINPLRDSQFARIIQKTPENTLVLRDLSDQWGYKPIYV